jgi:ABC-type transporter Mla maintaining outer membrane lipid asymmetry ATPase subunit MlaF
MSELAIRYRRKTARHEIDVSVPKGGVTRLHVPDEEAKAHLVTAMLKARCESDEELELFGESASALAPAERARVRAKVGAVSPIVGLMANLNAWENISLPAAYHGRPTLEQVAALAREVLGAFGADAAVFFARLPEELGVLERKIASFVRGLVAAPQIMIFDALEDGLSVAECRHAARFEAEYRARTPQGTLVYVDTREEA